MRINPFVYGFLVLAVFMGVILGFQAVGFWSVSGKVTNSGEAIQPSATDVNTIKGWMTLEQITSTYNVPMDELLIQFELPADTPASSAINILETDVFSVTNLRIWLQSRATQGQSGSTPAAPAEPTSAPASEPAAQPAKTEPSSSPAPAASASDVTPTPTAHVVPAKTVTGQTTFQELLDWGVSKEAIQAVIHADLPSPSTLVKDFAASKGLDFPTVKSALQAEVDKVK